MEPAGLTMGMNLAGHAGLSFLGRLELTQGNTTDRVFATIASIFDLGDSQRAAERPVGEDKARTLVPADADGYFKVGPGPIESIRFKWTVRRADNDEYFVDETIGESLSAIVSGPMTKDAAVKLVDERESDARRRFEQLRHEMAGRAAALEVIRKGGSDL
jgi:hypothetical protein